MCFRLANPGGGYRALFLNPLAFCPCFLADPTPGIRVEIVVLTSEQNLKKIKHCVNLNPLMV